MSTMPADPSPTPPIAAAPRIEMFSGPGCTYCARSRRLLEANGLHYVDYDVSVPEHLAEYRRRLPRQRSLPQIFVDGEHIGGFEDLQLAADAGRFSTRRPVP